VSTPKAVKHRRLALIEPDQDKARSLHKLAEESGRARYLRNGRLAGPPLKGGNRASAC
jgi:hypothetical protein